MRGDLCKLCQCIVMYGQFQMFADAAARSAICTSAPDHMACQDLVKESNLSHRVYLQHHHHHPRKK